MSTQLNLLGGEETNLAQTHVNLFTPPAAATTPSVGPTPSPSLPPPFTYPPAATASTAPEAPIFDISKPFHHRILSGAWKTCSTRYPSKEEWCERARKQKIVRKSLGRGKSMPLPQRDESLDYRLFELIRLDERVDERVDNGGSGAYSNGSHAEPPAEFDEAEASRVIQRLDRATVIKTDRGPDGYTLKLRSNWNSGSSWCYTTHILSIPTMAQALEHERACVYRTDDNALQILRINLEPSGVLYDKLVSGVSGYAGASPSCIPITHKFAVVFELLSAIERDMEGEDEEGPDPEA